MNNAIFFRLIFVGLISLSFSFMKAEQNVELIVTNQKVIADEVIFDIYLKATSATSDLYLGNADFVLDFNEENFHNPRVEKVQGTANFDMGTNRYFNNTVTTILDNKIIINSLGSYPSSQKALETSAPKIVNTPEGTFLGRYKITGIVNENGTAGLAWVCNGSRRTILLGHHNKELNERIINADCLAIRDHSLRNEDGFEVGTESFYLSPNPATTHTQLVFSLEEDTDFSYSIFNTLGQKVTTATLQKSVGDHVLPIDTREFTMGIYTVVLELPSGMRSFKLLVTD